MKYIITEEQKNYLEEFERFRRFMFRRDTEITNLILKFSKRPLTNFHMVVEQVAVEMSNIYHIDFETQPFRWLNKFIEDNYGEFIKSELGI